MELDFLYWKNHCQQWLNKESFSRDNQHANKRKEQNHNSQKMTGLVRFMQLSVIGLCQEEKENDSSLHCTKIPELDRRCRSSGNCIYIMWIPCSTRQVLQHASRFLWLDLNLVKKFYIRISSMKNNSLRCSWSLKISILTWAAFLGQSRAHKKIFSSSMLTILSCFPEGHQRTLSQTSPKSVMQANPPISATFDAADIFGEEKKHKKLPVVHSTWQFRSGPKSFVHICYILILLYQHTSSSFLEFAANKCLTSYNN